jgi:hypothetical protein
MKLRSLLREAVSRPGTILRRVLQAFDSYLKAATTYRTGYGAILRRLAHALRERYVPDEAYIHGLLDPRRPMSEFSKYCSASTFERAKRRINPLEWYPFANNKGLFAKHCLAAGIPTPKLLALLFKSSTGWSPEGRVLDSAESWIRFLEQDGLPDMIMKPTGAAFGYGVRAFRRENGVFIDHLGARSSAAELYDWMANRSGYPALILQERVYNHPALRIFTRSDGLQTVRIVTVVDGSGKSRIICTFFKPIVGMNIIDNTTGGLTGNLQAEVDTASGVIIGAVALSRDGRGWISVESHPDTGVRFEGFKMPLWEDACRVTNLAAERFLPLRTIGWDVAITPDRALIIEGNVTYDPPTQGKKMYQVLPAIENA